MLDVLFWRVMASLVAWPRISKLQFLFKKNFFQLYFFKVLSSKPWIQNRIRVRVHLKCWIQIRGHKTASSWLTKRELNRGLFPYLLIMKSLITRLITCCERPKWLRWPSVFTFSSESCRLWSITDEPISHILWTWSKPKTKSQSQQNNTLTSMHTISHSHFCKAGKSLWKVFEQPHSNGFQWYKKHTI